MRAINAYLVLFTHIHRFDNHIWVFHSGAAHETANTAEPCMSHRKHIHEKGRSE